MSIGTTQTVSFEVPGRPRPKGSMKMITSKTTGQAFPVKNPALQHWAAITGVVAIEALSAREREGLPPWQLDLPCEVVIRCAFARPMSHFGTGRNATRMKAKAPLYPIQRALAADVDKLARAVLDALTGIMWHDDAQVVQLTIGKWYAADGIPKATVVVAGLAVSP